MRNSQIKPLNFKASGLTKGEWQKLKNLSTPPKIQDFLNSLPFNFEIEGETEHSVRYVLKHRQAHCFEGALLATTALWIQGFKPLILDLVATPNDFDHVVALFKVRGYWGAISKTNHAVLRYREPVYKSIHELVMSYFHEYFLDNGKKTLRSYSEPFDLSKLGKNPRHGGVKWLTTEENLIDLVERLDSSPHKQILSLKQIKNLRNAELIEIKAGKIVEYRK